MHVLNGGGGLKVPPGVLDVLMPMHVALDATGRIRHTGPTIAKMLGGGPVTGTSVLAVFDLRRPVGIVDFKDMGAQVGRRLSLAPKSSPHLPMRAVLMPLAESEGMILDISLGLSFARAVSEFALTLHDFSPCDQTIDLLYLHEANSSTAGLSRRLSERLQAAHSAARQQALTDVLTGLMNRRAMDDELGHLLRDRGHEFSLLNMDLDRFKHVNDTYGHAAGDAVLVEVGRILARELRRTDFPARMGGDEFLVILRPALSPELAGRIATRLIERIEEPVRFENHICRISASIGIASTTQYEARPTAEQIMGDVDDALYRAKNAGRGRFALAQGGGMSPGR